MHFAFSTVLHIVKVHTCPWVGQGYIWMVNCGRVSLFPYLRVYNCCCCFKSHICFFYLVSWMKILIQTLTMTSIVNRALSAPIASSLPWETPCAGESISDVFVPALISDSTGTTTLTVSDLHFPLQDLLEALALQRNEVSITIHLHICAGSTVHRTCVYSWCVEDVFFFPLVFYVGLRTFHLYDRVGGGAAFWSEVPGGNQRQSVSC